MQATDSERAPLGTHRRASDSDGRAPGCEVAQDADGGRAGDRFRLAIASTTWKRADEAEAMSQKLLTTDSTASFATPNELHITSEPRHERTEVATTDGE